MNKDRRAMDRVHFGQGYTARIVSIDGTWARHCRIDDISNTGAKLLIDGSVEGLGLAEFFLVLSNVGTAHRRCELVRLNGEELGVRFVKDTPKTRRDERRPTAAAHS